MTKYSVAYRQSMAGQTLQLSCVLTNGKGQDVTEAVSWSIRAVDVKELIEQHGSLANAVDFEITNLQEQYRDLILEMTELSDQETVHAMFEQIHKIVTETTRRYSYFNKK